MTSHRAAMFTLGRLCRQVGLARSSVLHYESLGLLAASARSAAGYRLYSAHDLERLRSVRRLREAGLSLTDIRALLAEQEDLAPSRSPRPRAHDLLRRRLFELCADVERIKVQQRLLARLMALPAVRGERPRCSKAQWVELLGRAGLDEEAMQLWHAEFERDDPQGHAAFLRSLGMPPDEVDQVRQRARGAST